jgi:hypothetical protein
MTFKHELDTRDAPVALAGHPVVDSHLAKLGKVTDVIFDDRAGIPRWAIVRTGILGGERYVPLDNSYVDEDGRVVVSLDRATVRRAPRVRRDHVLTPEAQRALRDYYGVAA